MDNQSIIHNKGFLKSSNVKLFPCAYRGTNAASESLSLFDPEARLNTEYNFTHEGSGISDLVTSYIISWTPNLLVCMIAGYTFELKVSQQDFLDDERFKNKDIYIKIKLNQHDITSEYKTKVLGTQLKGTSSIDGDLDSVVDTVDPTQYFTGLVFVATAADTPESLDVQSNEYTLRILKANGKVDTLNLLPQIAKGSGNGSIILGKNTNNSKNKDGFPIHSNLKELEDQASGDYSVAMNSGSANGENSVAANKSTVSNEAAAGFNKSVVSGFMAFGANEGNATASDSAAFGTTTANKENQFTAGTYNDSTADTLVSIGNGSVSKAHNALEVEKTGNINLYTENDGADTKKGVSLEVISEYDNSNKQTNINLKTSCFTRDDSGKKTTLTTSYPIVSSGTNTFTDGILKASAANNFILGTQNILGAGSKNTYLLGTKLNNNNVSDILMTGADNVDLIPNTAFAVSNGKTAIPFSILATKNSNLAVQTLDCLEYSDLKNSLKYQGFDLKGHTLSDIVLKGGMDINGEFGAGYFDYEADNLKELRWTIHPITGIKTPALYFNNDEDYANKIDYNVPFFLYDTIKIDGTLYNRWIKSPVDEITNPWESYWVNFYRNQELYLLTNKVADVYLNARQTTKFTDDKNNTYVVVSSESAIKTVFKDKDTSDVIFGYECQRVNNSDETKDKASFSNYYCTTLDPENIITSKLYKKIDGESSGSSIVVSAVSSIKTIISSELITHIDSRTVRTGKLFADSVYLNNLIGSPLIATNQLTAEIIRCNNADLSFAKIGMLDVSSIGPESQESNSTVTFNPAALYFKNSDGDKGLYFKQDGNRTEQTAKFYANTTPDEVAAGSIDPALEISADGTVYGSFSGELNGNASTADVLSERTAWGQNKINEWWNWSGDYAAVVLEYSPDNESEASSYSFGIGSCGHDFYSTVITEHGTIYTLGLAASGAISVKRSFNFRFDQLESWSLSGDYHLRLFRVHN